MVDKNEIPTKGVIGMPDNQPQVLNTGAENGSQRVGISRFLLRRIAGIVEK
jgi:hypothetical protein